MNINTSDMSSMLKELYSPTPCIEDLFLGILLKLDLNDKDPFDGLPSWLPLTYANNPFFSLLPKGKDTWQGNYVPIPLTYVIKSVDEESSEEVL